MMKKNDLITLQIDGMSAEGSGVGRYEGMAVFVPETAVGDVLTARIVKVKKSYAYAIVEKIETASADRMEPDCPVARRCGGCVYRHISYESECRIKKDRVREVMHRIGGVACESEELIAAENTERYRNKAQYPVSPDGRIGFFAKHSHRVVACADCRLQPEIFGMATAAFETWLHESGTSVYDETTGRGLIRHFYLRYASATEQLMAVVVINGEKLPAQEQLIARLRETVGERLKSVQLNINRDDTNVILGKTCRILYGEPYITDILCGVRVRLSPLSFYQVNRAMAERLYRKAAEYACPDGKTVLDLYCGAGTIGLSMAKRAEKIIGVEIVPQAAEDAKANAAENGIENAEFICSDAAQAARMLAQKKLHPDVVIVDPPRKGCTPELLKTVSRDFCPERIVYVSCDPATLARDVALLTEEGYRLREYTPVDLFPRTAHVETVALLVRTVSSI